LNRIVVVANEQYYNGFIVICS